MWTTYDSANNPINGVPAGYSLVSRSVINQGTTSYTVPAGCRAILVEMIAGGGAGGGAATSSANCSLGGGGGGGAYTAKFIVGPKTTAYTIVVGAGGTAGAAGAAGNAGTDTVFDSGGAAYTAKAGAGGAVLAAGTTLVSQAGAAGGAASGGVGDVKLDGSTGGWGVRLSASTGQGGYGGAAPIGGGAAIGANATVTAGAAGKLYGGGGSGAFTATTSQVGGVGANGLMIVWEFM